MAKAKTDKAEDKAEEAPKPTKSPMLESIRESQAAWVADQEAARNPKAKDTSLPTNARRHLPPE